MANTIITDWKHSGKKLFKALALSAPLFAVSPAKAGDGTITIGTDSFINPSFSPFNGYSPEFQELYPSVDFNSSITITGLSFEIPMSVLNPPSVLQIPTQLYLSTTSTTFSGVVQPFQPSITAANLGADNTLVYSGLQPSIPVIPGTAFTFNFSTPFTYDPSKGNLLLDIKEPTLVAPGPTSGSFGLVLEEGLIPVAGTGIAFVNVTHPTVTESDNTVYPAGEPLYEELLGGGPLTTFLTTSTPPTLLQLAQLSADVYNPSAKGIPGFAPLSLSTSDSVGLKGNSYISPDGSQIVISFQGTNFDTADGSSLREAASGLLGDVASDTTFGSGGIASGAFKTTLTDAVNFVKELEAAYPNAHITLTGHSLGGAISQLIGSASGLDTEVFNAPGTRQALASVGNILTIAKTGPGTINTDYRVYNDQISQVGTPIGSVVTLPATTPFMTSSNAATEVALNFQNILDVHSIQAVISDIQANNFQSNSPSVSTSGELELGQAIQSTITPTITTYDSVTGKLTAQFIDLLVGSATASVNDLIDPTSGEDFLFTEQAGSPEFQCVTLPNLSNVASYDVRSEQGATWSAFEDIQPANQVCFPSGTDGLEFQPLNSSGQNLDLTDPFIFDATFASEGDFTGTLTESELSEVITPPSEVPEPASPWLMLPGIGFGLLFARRNKQNIKQSHRFEM